MKLRILGNSIRIRVSQTELTELSRNGHTRDEIVFAANQTLRYELWASDESSVLEARLNGGEISVSIPRSMAETWAGSDLVSLRGQQEIPDGQLKILVEKDFQCLEPRPDEDESNLFPNPNAGSC